jgi:HD superfamily phosphodiesterase
MKKLPQLIDAMTAYERGVPHRVGHFLKVYGYAKTIGTLEDLPEDTLFILETAAIVHDIGIKPSLEKYGSSAGKYQEREGGAVARGMLGGLGFAPEVIERVVYLVEHHHTYTDVDGLDYRILLEADFLVNMHEEEMSRSAIEAAYRNVFRTETGRRLCETLYLQG